MENVLTLHANKGELKVIGGRGERGKTVVEECCASDVTKMNPWKRLGGSEVRSAK